LVDEPASEERRRLAGQDAAMHVWWGAPIECASAMYRGHRAGNLSEGELATAISGLRKLEAQWIEVEPSPQVRQQAERLLRIHPLRAGDALQLAAAIIAADYEPEGLLFLTADTRLAEAAAKEGFKVG
jgi:hypothetical protein